MSGIMSLMQITASMTPQDFLIKQLEEKIADYKSAVLDSEKKSASQALTTVCMLQVFKTFNGDKSILDVLDEAEKIEKMVNVFNPGKQ